MVWRKRIQPVTQEQFFEQNAVYCSREVLAEKVYIMIHSYYLEKENKIRSEMEKSWENLFGVSMTDEVFEYMLVNAPIMLRAGIIEEMKQKKEVTSLKYLARTIVAFEFDLWILERYQNNKRLKLIAFEAYLKEKYGNFLDMSYGSFKKYDLCEIKNFENLAEELLGYHSKIQEMFDLILSNNTAKIQMENPFAERTKEYFLTRNVSEVTAFSKQLNPKGYEEKIEKQNSEKNEKVEKQDDKTEKKQEPVIIEDKTEEKTAMPNIIREYEIILREREARIENLERDIKEFKRQRDEAREFSVNQYDKGIRDLFYAMNDKRYGKVIDYFYALLQKEGIDETLASYLDNFFMALEDMEIEPIVSVGEKWTVKEENLIKEYNLEFDKSQYCAEKAKLKYAGWKYKDMAIEKPTLTLKEDEKCI